MPFTRTCGREGRGEGGAQTRAHREGAGGEAADEMDVDISSSEEDAEQMARGAPVSPVPFV